MRDLLTPLFAASINVRALHAKFVDLFRARVQVGRHELRVDLVNRLTVLAHDAEEGFAILLVATKRTAVIPRDPRRLRVRLSGHHRRDRRCVRSSLVTVVRLSA